MTEKDQIDIQRENIHHLKLDITSKNMAFEKMQKENEDLIDRVATAETNIDQKDEQIEVLTKKKNDYKIMVEQLKDKNKSIEEVLNQTEQSKVTEVKQMEQRIEARVAKIVLQKDSQMKQEKTMIMEKY